MKNRKKHKKTGKKPWPTVDAMEQVYAENLWGGGDRAFYSGEGSHHPGAVEPYIKAVGSFLKSFASPPVVCDLGCGDFNVGKELCRYAQTYIAVDIVEGLIARNRIKYKDYPVTFRCLDLAEDDIPAGDCAILRQVLQHVSNAEIQRILSKIRAFDYLIVTEHVPEGEFVPNKDIISGQGIRLKKRSGVALREEPFELTVQDEQQLLTTRLKGWEGVLVTTIYTI